MTRCGLLVAGLLALAGAAAAQQQQKIDAPPEASTMRLVGSSDLQARSAFLVSGAPDWRTTRMTQVYDLSDPAKPAKTRDFGLPGQEPGSTGAVPTGVRALDIRDPYHPKDVGYYIPSITDKTDKRCVKVLGADRCKVAIQTNNVETDARGYIYIVDRANTALHILELDGAARQLAGLK